MDSNHSAYLPTASFERIDKILAKPQTDFEEVGSLPDRDKLTYDNGFYANCSALFVDLRDSSALPTHYNRPALAKLYRAYISEVVAIMNGSELAREINIVGDCVWGVFNTPSKPNIDSVYEHACQITSLVRVLNYKLAKAGYKVPIRAGIGLAWGRALMIKAGQKGSAINDVVYMGDVVNRAAKLAALGSKTSTSAPVIIDNDFRSNLKPDYQTLTSRPYGVTDYFTSSAGNLVMENWYTANCT